MIEFKDVVLQYHYDEFAILKGATFALSDGINTVLADTQSGKSSICKLLLKDVAPNSGKILIDGADICGITNADLGILYLPSTPTFFERRSVRYNLEYPIAVRKIAKKERRQRAEEVANSLGIDFLDVKVGKLTAEQRKLVALARGLTVRRKIVLFDDFFDGEDTTIERVKSVLAAFESATCVILTSDKWLALGNVVLLDGGVTAYQGDADGAVKTMDGLDWIYDKIRSE